MPRTLTASDRRSLIRLASTMPVGSPERKAILAGLSQSAGMLSSNIDPDRVEGFNRVENMIKPMVKRNGPFDQIVKLIAEEADLMEGDMHKDMSEVFRKVDSARDALEKAVALLRRW